MNRMLEPIRKEITVPLDPGAAFQLFTAGIDRWWPLASHSVAGEDAVRIEFEMYNGGSIIEHTHEGAQHVWGTVTRWEPPSAVAFTWHPGREASSAQLVEVSFTPDRAGCRVSLVHGGWDLLGDSASALRDRYEKGWTLVLGERFAAECGT